MKIGKYSISNAHQPFIIAEMSGNHNQSLDRALKIVKAAADSGAHAVKLQTYTADTMTMDCKSEHFVINDEKSLWNGRKLYDLYQEAHTPWDWHKPIMDYAKKLGIECFSSPFDETAVDFLETLDVPAYKVASFEITHLPLIKKIAQTGKPLIISTGLATLDEIQEAVQTAKDNGAKDIIILKCTSSYPADASDANLATIGDMYAKIPDVKVGLSDHSMGIGVSVASIAYGAVLIEKHFTLDRLDGGVDSSFSLEPDELKMLVSETKKAWMSKGEIKYGGTKNEENSKQFRQSIWFCRDLKKGHIITKDDVKICRPGHGLYPKYYDEVMNRKLAFNVRKGDPVLK
jgi:pseudaminic acid synthase